MPEGFGYGIGRGLQAAAEGLWKRHDLAVAEDADREKKADALHEKGLRIAQNLQQYAMDTPDPTAIQFAGKSYKPEAATLIDQLKQTSEQVRGLFGPHETPALVQHFRKFLGKAPKPPTPDPRAAQYSPEGFAAEVPVQPDKTLETLNSIRRQIDEGNPGITPERRAQLFTEAVNSKLGIGGTDKQDPYEGFTPQEKADALRIKAGLEAKSGTPKPPVAKYESGELVGIDDPNTGASYHAGNIQTAPQNIQDEWTSRRQEAENVRKRKEDDELKKVQEAESREDRRFANQATLQAKAFANAFAQKDYAEVESIKRNADTKYSNALALSAFADDALKTHSAAKDKLLAGRLIRESEGRFNPAQYDNLVKNAGLGNTFEQWMNNVESGELTDKVRQQLVDVAHSLLSSAKTAKDALQEPASPGALKDKAKPGLADSDNPLGLDLTPKR